jgi:hypothetical protein
MVARRPLSRTLMFQAMTTRDHGFNFSCSCICIFLTKLFPLSFTLIGAYVHCTGLESVHLWNMEHKWENHRIVQYWVLRCTVLGFLGSHWDGA